MTRRTQLAGDLAVSEEEKEIADLIFGEYVPSNRAECVALARKILAARRTPPGSETTPQRKWLPIETAPYDGTVVLLGWREDDQWLAASGWYETAPADQCWYILLDTVVRPTHWAPMDPPDPED